MAPFVARRGPPAPRAHPLPYPAAVDVRRRYAHALNAALDRIGYNGTITFESFSSAVVSPALTRALCIWRETWDDSMELATSARRFVLEQRAAAAAA